MLIPNALRITDLMIEPVLTMMTSIQELLHGQLLNG